VPLVALASAAFAAFEASLLDFLCFLVVLVAVSEEVAGAEAAGLVEPLACVAAKPAIVNGAANIPIMSKVPNFFIFLFLLNGQFCCPSDQ
jgi:hypothetical protein